MYSFQQVTRTRGHHFHSVEKAETDIPALVSSHHCLYLLLVQLRVLCRNWYTHQFFNHIISSLLYDLYKILRLNGGSHDWCSSEDLNTLSAIALYAELGSLSTISKIARSCRLTIMSFAATYLLQKVRQSNCGQHDKSRTTTIYEQQHALCTLE